MERYIKPIGGEFWFDIDIFNKQKNNFENPKANFLSGGQSAINFIIEDLNFKHDEYVLVPSYLCPTILYGFKNRNIKYVFYEINSDLSINLKDIENKLKKYIVKALFFIDYFGFYHSNKTIQFLKLIQQTGVILIEDAVQMFWFKPKHFFGDYVFNSFRKFLPIDGSIVLGRKSFRYNSVIDKYYEYINSARMKKTMFHEFNIGNEEEFLDLYKKSEDEYYKRKNIIGMDCESKKLLSKVDYEFIADVRKKNYYYLYDNLINEKKISILFDKIMIEDNIPLGFPILIENRDIIRKKLRNYYIYAPVHWNISDESWSNKFKNSLYLSNNILTLPIDHRYTLSDMNRLIYSVIKLIKEC